MPAMRMLTTSLISLVILALPCAPRAGHWSPEYQIMGLDGPGSQDGQVRVFGEWSDELLVGGYIATAGGVPAPYFALWNGRTWRAVGATATGRPDATVHAMYDNGTRLWLGGDFTGGVARWDGVTEIWDPLGDSGADGVYAFEVFNGHLYAGGFFWTGDPYGLMAPLAWHDIDGWHYDLNTVGFQGPAIYDLQVWNLSLYLGGGFWIDSPAAVSLMRWDGEELHGYDVDGYVYCLEPTDVSLYAGGVFSHCDGLPADGLVRVGEGGTVAVDPPYDGFGVHALARSPGHPLAVASDNQEVYLYSGTWTGPLGGTLAGQPYAVTWFGGDLYAGGLFPNGVARWDGEVEEWINLGGGFPPGTAVNAVVAWNGAIYAGGMLAIPDAADDQVNSHLLQWDRGWRGVGGSPDNQVYALFPFQGSLIAGGDFTLAGGVPCLRIARWDGTTWHDLGGANGVVTSFCEHESELIVGGWFTTIGGLAAANVAVYDGESWRAFGGDVAGTINAVASFGGEVVIGGNRLARWDGAAWQPLGAGADGTARALAVSNGDLYAAGAFQNAGGAPASGIARWDGTAWHPLGVGLGGLHAGYGAMALQATSDRLFVGGAFTTAGGEPANCLAVWDGANWSELGEGVHDAPTPAISRVQAFAVMDGDLYLGGKFQRAGTVPSSNFALWVDGTLVSVAVRSFVATPVASSRVVDLSWNLAAAVPAADLRLTAQSASATWSVPFAADPSGGAGQNYVARDTAPALAWSTTVVYTLLQNDHPRGWVPLAEQTVTFADAAATPSRPRLSAQPNPFNPQTEVSFTLSRRIRARLCLYDLTGRLVVTLADAEFAAGRHDITWDGRDAAGRPLPSATYVARLATEDGIVTTKLLLMR